jgi:serine/threonine-protein kinase
MPPYSRNEVLKIPMNEELTTQYDSGPPQQPAVSPPSDDGLQPGDILGGCAIESFIARGGMGSVYRASKLSLRSVVALKVLRSSFLTDPTVLSRFLREARVAASLSHPGIVRVFDVGQDRGLYYIVLEFVEGKDLQKIIKSEGPLKPREALRVARQVAEALAYAHSQGVVHRDVKPGNILMARDGSV